MYLIAERLRRPMEKFYGTKYIALLGFRSVLLHICRYHVFSKKIQGKGMERNIENGPEAGGRV
jgi:hypothetical protein